MKCIRVFLCCIFYSTFSYGQEKPAETSSATEKAIDELKREISTRDQVIRNLIQRIERLEATVGELRRQRRVNRAHHGRTVK